MERFSISWISSWQGEPFYAFGISSFDLGYICMKSFVHWRKQLNKFVIIREKLISQVLAIVVLSFYLCHLKSCYAFHKN
jgi:hypothetical protein